MSLTLSLTISISAGLRAATRVEAVLADAERELNMEPGVEPEEIMTSQEMSERADEILSKMATLLRSPEGGWQYPSGGLSTPGQGDVHPKS